VIFATRCYATAALAVMRCLYVCCVSVTFLNCVKMNKHIFKKFSPSGSHTILVFAHQMLWQYFDGDPPNGGVECRWGRQKSRFWAYIWLHCVLSTQQLAVLSTRLRRPRVPQVVTLTAGSKRRSLLIARDDDEMFMTRSLNVTPKTTGQHVIARSDKSVAYVTKIKRLLNVLYYWN